LMHPLSGVLSAYGMGLADIRASRSRAMMVRLDVQAELETVESELEGAAAAELIAQGVGEADITIIARAHLRYDGTDTPLPVVILERALLPSGDKREDALSPLAGEI